MVPPLSLRIPRVRRYSGSCCSVSHFAYKAFTSSGSVSQQIRLCLTVASAVLTPDALLLPVWPLPLSLATTLGISFDFSSSAYLDVSVRRVPRIRLFFSPNASGFFILRVSPFGNPRILRLFAAPRGLSQLVTSFFGS